LTTGFEVVEEVPRGVGAGEGGKDRMKAGDASFEGEDEGRVRHGCRLMCGGMDVTANELGCCWSARGAL